MKCEKVSQPTTQRSLNNGTRAGTANFLFSLKNVSNTQTRLPSKERANPAYIYIFVYFYIPLCWRERSRFFSSFSPAAKELSFHQVWWLFTHCPYVVSNMCFKHLTGRKKWMLVVVFVCTHGKTCLTYFIFISVVFLGSAAWFRSAESIGGELQMLWRRNIYIIQYIYTCYPPKPRFQQSSEELFKKDVVIETCSYYI